VLYREYVITFVSAVMDVLVG